MENNSCIIYTDFLEDDVNSELYNHTISISEKFSQTKLGKGIINEKWRKSNAIISNDFSKFSEIVKEKIIENFVEICEKLKIDIFDIKRIETHLTSHNNGEFYKPHIDTGTGKMASRVITFVYYFHSIPKLFTGGQLLFLKNQPRPLIVEPANNSIVFFNSSLVHAVHPINCPDKKFEHGRFTLNGWIHRK